MAAKELEVLGLDVDACVQHLQLREDRSGRRSRRAEGDRAADDAVDGSLAGEARVDGSAVVEELGLESVVSECPAHLESFHLGRVLEDHVAAVTLEGTGDRVLITDGGVVGEPLAVIQVRSETDRLDDHLEVGVLVLRLDVAEWAEGTEVSLVGAHGNHEAVVVGSDDTLELNADGVRQVVHKGLDVVHQLLALLRGDEAEDDLLWPVSHHVVLSSGRIRRGRIGGGGLSRGRLSRGGLGSSRGRVGAVAARRGNQGHHEDEY